MKPKEFIAEHKVAVDYNNGVSVPMLSISNAEKAVALAEYNLAKDLLELHENARIETLERIVLTIKLKQMKTIKQAAKEYSDSIFAQDIFEEGARFVLEQVKETLSHPIRFVEAQEENKSIEVAQIDALNELINQLENK